MVSFDPLYQPLLSFMSYVGLWRLAALAFVLANLKVLPFGWHVRLFYGYFRHYYFDRRPIPPSTPQSMTLFQPTFIASTTPLGELDYNNHKSNSTYFTDLDMARGHHVYCLFRTGIKTYSSKTPPPIAVGDRKATGRPGRFILALGGVTCTFKRELTAYQPYEIWTRVMAWDDKWVYLISHIVKKGKVKPMSYIDQPWRMRGTRTKSSRSSNSSTWTSISQSTTTTNNHSSFTSPHPAVCAMSMSKYAFKQGRITISPTTFLQACDLLPPTPPNLSSGDEIGAERPISSAEKQSAFTQANTDLWNAIQERRKEGLKIAEHMARLDEGFALFTGEEDLVFASY